MKRTLYANSQKIKAYSVALQRLNMAKALGSEYGGKRDIYQALGYAQVLKYEDYYVRYKRQSLAAAVIDRPVNTTWRGDVELVVGKTEDTQLEKAWRELYDDLQLKSVFQRVDKLAAIGEYAILLLGFDDTSSPEAFAQPVQGTRKLMYVRPFSQHQAQITSDISDPSDPRFGLPQTYTIQVNNDRSIVVHHSRVIHITGPILDDEVRGIPAMEKVFNNLQDTEKVTGGSSEMFWRGARPGYQGVAQSDYQLGPTMADDLKDQVEEYENNLRRILVNEGIKLEQLEMQVADPSSHVDVQIQMISAGTYIPKRILLGSERGELASSQDKDEWYAVIQARREEYAEPNILDKFVSKCQEVRILPATDKNKPYHWEWEDLMTTSDKDKAEVGRIRATALKEYTSNPTAESIMPPEMFLQHFLGLSEVEVDIITEAMQKQIADESNITPEEQAILDAENNQVEEAEEVEVVETNMRRTK